MNKFRLMNDLRIEPKIRKSVLKWRDFVDHFKNIISNSETKIEHQVINYPIFIPTGQWTSKHIECGNNLKRNVYIDFGLFHVKSCKSLNFENIEEIMSSVVELHQQHKTIRLIDIDHNTLKWEVLFQEEKDEN